MAEPAREQTELRLRGGFNLQIETSALADLNPQPEEDAWLLFPWLDLRVPLQRDAAGNYYIAEKTWLFSVSGRPKRQPAEEPMEVCEGT